MHKPIVQPHQNEQALLDEIARLNKIVQELTIHDPLTGLYNRRHINETFDRELIRAERHRHPISVIMADIDHFKVINETYGHLAGDEVLKAFGILLKRNSRGSDIFCRYGGEEFLLVLTNMKEEDVCKRAEQLRNSFSTIPITSGASIIHATASFGIAVFPAHGNTSEELIAAADMALRSAKDDGRNQVTLFNTQMNPNTLI